MASAPWCREGIFPSLAHLTNRQRSRGSQVILSLLGAIAAAASCAARCPCTVQPGHESLSRTTVVQQARSNAYAVILGRVIRADTLAWDSLFIADSRRPIVVPILVRYLLDSVTSWKGPRQDQVQVLVPLAYTTCGRSLELNQQYLLFTYPSRSAGGDGGELDSCSRVESKSQLDSTVAILGRPRHRPRNRRGRRPNAIQEQGPA